MRTSIMHHQLYHCIYILIAMTLNKDQNTNYWHLD